MKACLQKESRAALRQERGGRISLAGAQDKMLLSSGYSSTSMGVLQPVGRQQRQPCKNLSILQTLQEGVRLAPFYDMMSTTCTQACPKNSLSTSEGKQLRQHAGGTFSGNGRPTGFQAEISI